MAIQYATIRIHAGLYLSGDGNYQIRRKQRQIGRGWEWVVSVLDEGCFVVDKRFRTLKVARQYVEDRIEYRWLGF